MDAIIPNLGTFRLEDFIFNSQRIENAAPHMVMAGEDSPRYLRSPHVDFDVPWFANLPRGQLAFVWWAGMEGVSLSNSLTLGVHNYIGGGVDVEVIFKDELHISMSGNFYGNTAPDEEERFRSVVQQDAPEGRVLVLPGPLRDGALVEVLSYNFSHDPQDETESFAYSIEFIRSGLGPKIDIPDTPPAPTGAKGTPAKPKPKGKHKNAVVATTGANTLRQLAAVAYGSPTAQNIATLLNNNSDVLDSLNLSPFQALNHQFKEGTKLAI